LHRGLDRLDTLVSHRDGLIERGLEPLIGFEQRMPIIRRGDTGAGCQLAPVPAIAMLQFNGTTPPQRSGRPVLRLIEGGLSRA
jgi:hypothetical protein